MKIIRPDLERYIILVKQVYASEYMYGYSKHGNIRAWW